MKPTGIFQADWQLSFVSVLGILPIQIFLTETTWGWFVTRELNHGIFKIVSFMIVTLAVSF
jgi:hypothetical protein